MARHSNLSIGKLKVDNIAVGEGSLEQLGLVPFYLKGTTKTAVADGTTAALTIPANTLVLQVYSVVVTAAGEACTATVGDGDSATGWDASIDLNATAGTRYGGVPGTDAFTVGKLYSTADTIDYVVTLNGGTGSVQFRCEALCVKMA